MNRVILDAKRRELAQWYVAREEIAKSGGVKEYKIGTRELKRYSLSEINEIIRQLEGEIARMLGSRRRKRAVPYDL